MVNTNVWHYISFGFLLVFRDVYDLQLATCVTKNSLLLIDMKV